MSREFIVGLRALLLWLALTAVAPTVAVTLAGPALVEVRLAESAGFEALLAATCAAALLLATGWCWLVTTSELLAVACRTRPRLRAPVPLRRLVAVACGVGVLATSAPAYAAPTDPGPGPASGRTLVVGLPLPSRPLGEAPDPARQRSDVAPRPVLSPRVAPSPGLTRSARSTVVVATGDSLWTIADRLLPDDAGTAEIDQAWRSLWHANRDAIGTDPDLILPGTTLHLTDPKEPR